MMFDGISIVAYYADNGSEIQWNWSGKGVDNSRFGPLGAGCYTLDHVTFHLNRDTLNLTHENMCYEFGENLKPDPYLFAQHVYQCNITPKDQYMTLIEQSKPKF